MRIRSVKIDSRGRFAVQWQEQDERGQWVGRAVNGAGHVTGELMDGMNKLATLTAKLLDVGGKNPELSVSLAGMTLAYPPDGAEDTNVNVALAIWLCIQKGDKPAKVTAPSLRTEPRKRPKLGEIVMDRALFDAVEIVRDCALEYVKEHGKA